MAKKLTGIVVGNQARKKAGLRYKISEGYNTQAIAFVKSRALRRRRAKKKR